VEERGLTAIHDEAFEHRRSEVFVSYLVARLEARSADAEKLWWNLLAFFPDEVMEARERVNSRGWIDKPDESEAQTH
jgi:hypothetical protein